MTELNQLLKTAIQTAKAGEREQAHQLLLQIIKQDEKNEIAWLWLSGVVKAKKDRQICLENVLAINPENAMAMKGLKKLGAPIPQLPPLPSPIEEKEEIWDEPQYDLEVPEANDPHASKFQDVWSGSANICAYCAYPVERSDRKCPKCKRRMVGKELLTPKRSKYLLIWVILRSLSHVLSLISIFTFASSLPEFIAEIPIAFSMTSYLLTVFFSQLLSIGFTIALFLRQAWAYWLTIAGIALMVLGIVALAIFAATLPPTPSSGAPAWLGFLCISPFIILQILYVYMVVMAGDDFRRVKRWRVAAVDDRIKDPLAMDQVAKLYSQQNMWATAVLYWQRAVGRSPGNIAILRRLADGYARLGFPERGLDTLRLAQEKTLDPKTRETLSKQIDQLTKIA